MFTVTKISWMIVADCLCKCDPKPQCLILSGTSSETNLLVTSWNISEVCFKWDTGLSVEHTAVVKSVGFFWLVFPFRERDFKQGILNGLAKS